MIQPFILTLTSLWQELLGVENVSPEADFFHLGGRSLQALLLVSRAQDAFAIELTLVDLFENRKLDAFALLCMRRAAVNHEPALTFASGIDLDVQAPLSITQDLFWQRYANIPDDTACNVQWALRITGPLDHARFSTAVDAVVARHEALRLVFGVDLDGRPHQHLTMQKRDVLTIRDVEFDEGTAVREIAEQESKIAFDLTTGPLLRLTLLTVAPSVHVLFLTIHHIITDGKSTSLVLHDLARFYAESSPQLDPITLTPRGYAFWEERYNTPARRLRCMDYWNNALGQESSALQRFARQQLDFDAEELVSIIGAEIPSTDRIAIESLCKLQGTTPFAVILSAYALALMDQARCNAMPIRVPIANRRHSETDHFVGLIMQTTVVRTAVSDTMTVGAYIAAQHHATVDAMTRGELPFGYIANLLEQDGRPLPPGVADVMLSFNDGSDIPKYFGDCLVERLRIDDTGATKAPVQITAIMNDSLSGGYDVTLQFTQGLFEQAQMQLVIDMFMLYIKLFAEHEDKTIGEMRALAADLEAVKLQSI